MEKTKKPDSLKFVIHATVWALLIMALAHAYSPYINLSVPEEQLQEVSRQMIDLSPAVLARQLGSKEKPVLLFVYASWCGYCRETLPQLMQAKDAGRLDGVELLFLSVDKERRKLALYLAQSGFAGKFPAYQITEGNGGMPLIEAVRGAGGDYRGALPYIALFREGKMEFSIPGNPDETEMQNLLHRVALSFNP